MKKDIDKIIADYLRGDISEKDKIRLDKWLNDDPEHIDHLNALKEIWEAPLDHASIANQESERQKLWNRLNNPEETKTKQPKTISLGVFMKYAAAVSVLLTVGYLLYFNQSSDENAPPQEIVRINPMGQKSKIQLPDGSRVWLNADSKLTYTTDYNKTTRSLFLEGEAFFEVTKNPEVPFEVHTNDLIVTALGTSFNVNAFRKKTKEKVALRTGKVKVETQPVSDKDKSVSFLSPGEQANFDNESGTIEVSKIEVGDPYGWKDGRLTFHRATLQEVIEVLERWYNVEIEVRENTKKKEWEYTATFKNEVLENVLESLKFSEKITYQMTGSKIKIKL